MTEPDVTTPDPPPEPIQTVCALASDGTPVPGPDGADLTATFASWTSGTSQLVLWAQASSAGPDAHAVADHAVDGSRLTIRHAGYVFDGVVRGDPVPLYGGQQLAVHLELRDPQADVAVEEADPPEWPAMAATPTTGGTP